MERSRSRQPAFLIIACRCLGFAVLLGSALIALGIRRQSQRLNLERWATVAALSGVAVSSPYGYFVEYAAACDHPAAGHLFTR